jgi:hypothetical protein
MNSLHSYAVWKLTWALPQMILPVMQNIARVILRVKLSNLGSATKKRRAVDHPQLYSCCSLSQSRTRVAGAYGLLSSVNRTQKIKSS